MIDAQQHQAALSPRGPTWVSFIVLLALIGACMLIGGCGPKAISVPPPAPAAVEVLVPVMRPCEVAQVEVTPVAKSVPHDIYGAVQAILADRQNLLADREELVAANTDPCPEVKQ